MTSAPRTPLLRRAALAAEAAAAITGAYLATRLLGPPRLMRRLGHPEPAATESTPQDDPAATESRTQDDPAQSWRASRRVACAVDRVADALPWQIVCLPRALATRAMLRRRGIRCELQLGIASTTPLSAHAWITTGGRVVQGGPVGHVTRLATLR